MPSDSDTKSPPHADVLLHISSFLNQLDFGSTKLALGHLLHPKSLSEHALQEEKADNRLDASGASQALSSAAIASKATASKRLLYNASAFHKISAAGQLLKATGYAAYDQVEKLIADKNNLDLMFEPVSFKFRDDSEERISPLRYAFKVYDTYMWKTVFLKRIEEIKDPEKREEGLKKFFAQMQEQEKAGHIDLEPLFEAYGKYNRQHQSWWRNGISDQDLHNAWYSLGKKQKALLPVHMLKEFSRVANTWHENASFDVDRRPRPSNYRIYNNIVKAWQSLSSILSDSAWGTSFSLVRGPATDIATSDKHGHPDKVVTDFGLFQRLFKARSNDFKNALESQTQQAQQVDAVKQVIPRHS